MPKRTLIALSLFVGSILLMIVGFAVLPAVNTQEPAAADTSACSTTLVTDEATEGDDSSFSGELAEPVNAEDCANLAAPAEENGFLTILGYILGGLGALSFIPGAIMVASLFRKPRKTRTTPSVNPFATMPHAAPHAPQGPQTPQAPHAPHGTPLASTPNPFPTSVAGATSQQQPAPQPTPHMPHTPQQNPYQHPVQHTQTPPAPQYQPQPPQPVQQPQQPPQPPFPPQQ